MVCVARVSDFYRHYVVLGRNFGTGEFRSAYIEQYTSVIDLAQRLKFPLLAVVFGSLVAAVFSFLLWWESSFRIGWYTGVFVGIFVAVFVFFLPIFWLNDIADENNDGPLRHLHDLPDLEVFLKYCQFAPIGFTLFGVRISYNTHSYGCSFSDIRLDVMTFEYRHLLSGQVFGYQ